MKITGRNCCHRLVVTHLPRLKEIIPAMLVQTAEFHIWGLLWIMAGMLALLGWRALARRYVLAMWILLGLHLMSYALAYSVTPWDLTVLMPMTMDRLLLHAVPAVIFLAGWHWAEVGTGHRMLEILEHSRRVSVHARQTD